MDNSIILIRTSTKEQEPELQIKDCEDYNIKKGWNLIKTFKRHESAYKNEEGVWRDEIEWAKKNEVVHIIVWNMDRFSRLPEEKVLDDVRILSTLHNIQVHAVHGDAWSELVETIGKIKEMGFVGKAVSEFLETVLRGLEHQRAHRESVVKGERVRMAVKSRDGITMSYKGNKWGRRPLPKRTIERVLELNNNGLSMREIAGQVTYTDSNNKPKKVSLGVVHKIIQENKGEKDSLKGVQQ